MTSNKQNIISIASKQSANDQPVDANLFLDNPEVLQDQIKAVAAVDASKSKLDPDKPATRVTSLSSFLTDSKKSPFAFKKASEATSETESVAENVKAFPKANPSKSQKK